MNYEQLYIDGVLMDTDDKTNILLELKSNLFADISKMASNKTYTIHLPKTVHNLTVLGHTDRVHVNSRWPYEYHTARYYRNGVGLITDGRAALLSVGETLEIAIVWGLSSAFDALKKDDIKLNELGGSESIVWDTRAALDTPAALAARGYGYANYSPWINEANDEGWQSGDAVEVARTDKLYSVINGYSVQTGTNIGDIVFVNPMAREGWGYLSIPFRVGMDVMLHAVGGTGNDRLWSVLDKYDRVVSIAAASDVESLVAFNAPANAARLLVNINITASSHSTVRVGSRVSGYTNITFSGSAAVRQAEFLVHPSATAAWVLRKIAASTGVTCSWSGDALTLVNSLAIPLINKKANYTSAANNTFVFLQPTSQLGDLDLVITAQSSIFTNQPNVPGKVLTVARDATIVFDAQAVWDWDASDARSNADTTVGYDGVEHVVRRYSYNGNYIVMTITPQDGDPTEYIIGRENGATVDSSDNLVNNRFRHLLVGFGTIDVQAGDEIEFELKNSRGTLPDMQFLTGTIIAQVQDSEDVQKGEPFPIVYNLPEIKVVDFVKFLAAITGTFPLQRTSSEIRFVPLATLWDNFVAAVDWTRKVVPAYNTDKPKQLDYRLSGWARQNWYRWAQDDTVVGDYDGVITIADDTMDIARDVFTFPFAASDGNSVPMYSRPKGGGVFGNGDGANVEEPSYSACKPRILCVREDANGKAELYFDINMQAVINDKYAHITAALQHAKVIKEGVVLSNVEILAFDETVPVYLQQHASYFAVLEIKAASNGIAEVTMLKL